MFIVDKATKKSSKVEAVTFSSLGLREREDLQEWIVNEPSILGEELLIIQKEFAGFSDTKERLDLLAVDRQGNLLIIENKLDSSGKDVTWQAMKYASYCSTLSKEQIRSIYQEYLTKHEPGANAEEKLCDFLDTSDFAEVQLNHDLSQRIILVARQFRKEVTSTVLWARKFRIQIQCIKIIPYTIAGHLVIDTEQIIPVEEISGITVSSEDKAMSDAITDSEIAKRKTIRDRFWKQLLPSMNEKSELFKGINADAPHFDHWLGTGSGITGLSYTFVITQKYAGIELSISKSEQDENKKIFERLLAEKESIETAFGHPLDWQRLPNKKMSRIAYKLEGANVFNEDDWPKMLNFLIKYMLKFHEVMKSYIAKLKQ